MRRERLTWVPPSPELSLVDVVISARLPMTLMEQARAQARHQKLLGESTHMGRRSHGVDHTGGVLFVKAKSLLDPSYCSSSVSGRHPKIS